MAGPLALGDQEDGLKETQRHKCSQPPMPHPSAAPCSPAEVPALLWQSPRAVWPLSLTLALCWASSGTPKSPGSLLPTPAWPGSSMRPERPPKRTGMGEGDRNTETERNRLRNRDTECPEQRRKGENEEERQRLRNAGTESNADESGAEAGAESERE